MHKKGGDDIEKKNKEKKQRRKTEKKTKEKNRGDNRSEKTEEINLKKKNQEQREERLKRGEGEHSPAGAALLPMHSASLGKVFFFSMFLCKENSAKVI